MLAGLAATALLMGLAGGPHCVAMCGAACGGVARLDARSTARGLLLFQAGRMEGYCTLGALAAASVQAMGWLGTQVAALRPVWMLFHVAALLLGLVMLWQARQPAWMDGTGRRIWAAARSQVRVGAAAGGRVPGVAMATGFGALWALMPCGLLYSALLVAALSGSPLEGAGVMALFALGSGAMLAAGPWLWQRLRGHGAGQGAWGVRLAGLALAVLSAWAIWMGLVEQTAPWCMTP
jgi:sulfite exporter TauE/SafE